MTVGRGTSLVVQVTGGSARRRRPADGRLVLSRRRAPPAAACGPGGGQPGLGGLRRAHGHGGAAGATCRRCCCAACRERPACPEPPRVAGRRRRAGPDRPRAVGARPELLHAGIPRRRDWSRGGGAGTWRCWCAARARAPPSTCSCVSLAYVPIGAAVALRSYEYLGLPTPDAMLRVLTATFTAPGELLTTIPPVDATGQVMVLPYAIGFLVAASSGWLAIATDRPMAPVVAAGGRARASRSCSGTQDPDVAPGARPRCSPASPSGGCPCGADAGAVTWSTRTAGGCCAASGCRGPGDGRGGARPPWPCPTTPPRSSGSCSGAGSGAVRTSTALDNPLAGFRRFTRQPAEHPRQPVRRQAAAGARAARRPAAALRHPRRVRRHRAGGPTTAPSTGRRTTSSSAIGTEVAASRAGRRVEVQVEVRRGLQLVVVAADRAADRDHASTSWTAGRSARTSATTRRPRRRWWSADSAARDDYAFTAVLPTTRLTPGMRPYGTGEPLVREGAFLDDVPRGMAQLRPDTDGEGLLHGRATCARTVATATVRRTGSGGSRPGRLPSGSARGSSGPGSWSATTSSTPPSWRWRPTGSAYPLASWWEPSPVPRATCSAVT